MRKDIALTRFSLVKYLLPAPLEVQAVHECFRDAFSDFRFEDKIDSF